MKKFTIAREIHGHRFNSPKSDGDRMGIREKLNALEERLRFKYVPRLANWLIAASTARARQTLKQHERRVEVLIDNTVLAHGITHETAWISTGTQKWGTHEVQTGYTARIPVYATDNESVTYQHIRYLPGIASLARQGLISPRASAGVSGRALPPTRRAIFRRRLLRL